MGPPKPQVQKLKRQENLARCKRSVSWLFSPLAGNSVWFNDALILLFACIISVHSLCEQRRHFTNVWTSIEYNETYHIWLSWKKKTEQDSLHQNPKKRGKTYTKDEYSYASYIGAFASFWWLIFGRCRKKKLWNKQKSPPHTHMHRAHT